MVNEIKYSIYRIGIDDGDLEKANLQESFSMNFLFGLPDRLRIELIEHFEILIKQLRDGKL